MNKITNINPTINDVMPDLIESSPKSGPTVLSSTTNKGVGNAPERSNKAKSVASWNEKLPEIIPLPEGIGSFIEGALIIFPSKIIANLLPTLSVVILPNFCEPSLSRVKDTAGLFDWLLKLGWASTKFSPLSIILLLIFNTSLVSEVSLSTPNSSFSETNLKFNLAVFPRRSFILSGSLSPGNSTKILFSPLCRIVGSLVPTSSILLLMISIDCFKAELFIVNKPYFENETLTFFSLIVSKSNSKELYFEIYGFNKLSVLEKNNSLNFSTSSTAKLKFFSSILKFE